MFHYTTVTDTTLALLREIFTITTIQKDFALAGGTSLALQIGHRDSIDLDIFTHTQFNPDELFIDLQNHFGKDITFVHKNKRMLFVTIKEVKCDFVTEWAAPNFPFLKDDFGVNYYDVKDIVAMKMHTICGRGKRKDFFDIYASLTIFGWKQMLQYFEQKYGDTQFNILWRSINYFVDADENAPIKGFPPYTKNWKEIKEFITKEIIL